MNTAERLGSYPKVTIELPSSCRAVAPELPWRCSWQQTGNDQNLNPRDPGQAHGLRAPEPSCAASRLGPVLQCVELSVRQLKSNGSIPSAAIHAYEAACDERLALGGL